MSVRKRSTRIIECLESRNLLAAELIAHWVADDLVSDQPISKWTDQIAGHEVSAVGQPVTLESRFGGRATVQLDPADGEDFFRLDPNKNPLPEDDFAVAATFTATPPIAGEGKEWFTNTGLVDANTLGFGTDWGVSLAPTGQASAGTGGGFGRPSTTIYSTADSLADGGLHTVIFAREGSTLSLFVDGELSARTENASPLPRTQRDVTFGILQNGMNALHGEIAQVRFYAGAMSDAEAASEYERIRGYYQNQPPMTTPDAYSLAEDVPLFFVTAAQGVLSNDTDAEGDPIRAELVSSTQNGTLNFNPDGSFLYSPESDFFGIDRFTYRAWDHQGSEVTVVTLDVRNVYDAPVGMPDRFKILPSQVIATDAASGVLANDLNPDRAELTAVLEKTPEHGTFRLRADGSFDYDPSGFAGTDSFQYRINDGVRLSQPIDVTLQINTPPQAKDDSYRGTEDQLLIVDAERSVTRNDDDAEGDSLSAVVVDGPLHGTLSFSPDGSFSYQPIAEYFGRDFFTYRANDGIDESNLATVVLEIEPQNDPPVAHGDVYFASQGTTFQVNEEAGLLQNDSDIDSETFKAVIVTGPDHGEVDIDPTGSFRYSPRAGFRGRDTFTYSAVDDSNAISAAATVTIFVDASPVRVSEFMAANVQSLETSIREEPDDRFPRDKIFPDWIELVNEADIPIDIGGFHLSDDRDTIAKWTFPAGFNIPAGDRVLVFASGKNLLDSRLDEQGLLHTNFSLDVRGEELFFALPNGQIIDQFESSQQYPEISFGTANDGTVGYLLSPTPGEPNVGRYDGTVSPIEFSVERGVYDSPFSLQLSTSTPNTTIRFTTDGSAPTTDHGLSYAGPISIDATSTIRAAAFADGLIPSEVQTHTYLFLADVIAQPEIPEGYPTTWAGMPASYGMDPDVVGTNNLFNDIYRDSVIDDLKSLPSLSLVFDPDDFFDRQDGIYQNPTRTGDAWERPTSVEFFDPQGKEPGFHVNSGIRIMGGSSRQPDIPKHSMRLEFREQYGWSSLEYPFYQNAPFSEGATSSFDELVIRVGFNNSWMHRHYYQAIRGEQPRDQWVRDLQFAMGQPSARGRFVHVYLNGMYWGIYNIQERPAAPHMAEYFGGDKDFDWDVISSGTAIDGNTRAWTQLHRDARQASDPAVFQQLQQQVDMVNLADYMLLNFYVGNTDWDGHNWISAAKRGEPFRFFAWDSEFAISLPPSNNAVGENAERQIINVNKTNQNTSGNPSGLHRLLLRNEEYRMLFADRVQKHMFNDGVLTPEVAKSYFVARSQELDRAVVAESARWGDFRRDVNPGRWRSDQFDLYTRDEYFLAQQDFILNRYLPVRTDIVIGQLQRGNVFPRIDAPVLNQHGGRVRKGFQVSLSQTEDARIYYTLDGTDPRQAGGAVADTAIVYAGPFSIDGDTIVRTRALQNGEWSALSEAHFQTSVPASSENLRISEIHYHPAPPSPQETATGFDDADDFEFLELLNISNDTIDLSNVRFATESINGQTEGVAFDFGDSTIKTLEPGQRVLVVENLAAFRFRYGATPRVAGQWAGRLSNAGEQLTLIAGADIVQQFRYLDDWYPETDGRGFSLESADPANDDLSLWGSKNGWRPSSAIGGSPGRADRIPGDVNGDGVFNSSDFVLVFQHGEYEDDIPNNSTFEEGDWDGDGDFTTSDLVFVFQLNLFQRSAIPGNHDSLIFDRQDSPDVESPHNNRHGLAVDQAFSDEGESDWLAMRS